MYLIGSYNSQTLKRLTSKYRNVECILDDFLNLDQNEFEEVEYISVDAPCSGSGMIGFRSHLVDSNTENDDSHKDRLRKLQGSQNSRDLQSRYLLFLSVFQLSKPNY